MNAKQWYQRIIILFPGLIILLSLTSQTDEYIYEGQIDVHNSKIASLDDNEVISNALEIKTVSNSRKIIVMFASSVEKNNWLQVLRQPVKLGPANVTSKPTLSGIFYPVSTPPASRHQTPPLPPQHHPHLPRRTRVGMCSLRPYPPLRPIFGAPRDGDGARSPKSAKKFSVVARKKSERTLSQEEYLVYKKIDDQKVLEDDATLLNVIEAYCNSARTRHTVNSMIIENPQMLIADEEKLIFEEMRGGEVVFEERTLVDTVYSLRDQINELKKEQQRLSIEISEERKARKKLENLFKMAANNGPEYLMIAEINNCESER